MPVISTDVNWDELVAQANADAAAALRTAVPTGAPSLNKPNMNRIKKQVTHYKNIFKNAQGAKVLPFSSNIQAMIASYSTGLDKMSLNQQKNVVKKHINTLKSKAGVSRRSRRTRRSPRSKY